MAWRVQLQTTHVFGVNVPKKNILKWSINDPAHGARSIEEIKEMAKLPKRSKLRFNCCSDPIFCFIPISRVVIDSLHLFLRISDVLINLLIRDMRILDGTVKLINDLPDKQKAKNMTVYVEFLNGPCKIGNLTKIPKN